MQTLFYSLIIVSITLIGLTLYFIGIDDFYYKSVLPTSSRVFMIDLIIQFFLAYTSQNVIFGEIAYTIIAVIWIVFSILIPLYSDIYMYPIQTAFRATASMVSIIAYAGDTRRIGLYSIGIFSFILVYCLT